MFAPSGVRMPVVFADFLFSFYRCQMDGMMCVFNDVVLFFIDNWMVCHEKVVN